MSVKVMGLAWYVDGLSPAQKAVLVALADHANDEGRHVYPGVKRLTYKTSYAERTVRRALSDLREMGLIHVAKEATHHETTEYYIDLPEMQARQKRPARDAPQDETDLPESPSDLPESTNRPARGSAKPSVNHQEPSDTGVARVTAFYESHFGTFDRAIADEMVDAVDDYGANTVIEAMGLASEKNKHWRYALGILENWRREGKGNHVSQNGTNLKAWTVVMQAVKKNKPKLIMEDEEIFEAVNNCGRWPRFRDAPTSEHPFLKREFLKEYANV